MVYSICVNFSVFFNDYKIKYINIYYNMKNVQLFFNNIINNIDKHTNWMLKRNIINIISLLLIIYACFITNNLYSKYLNIFKFGIVKFIICVLILFASSKSPQLAIVLIIVLFTVMMTNYKHTNEFMSSINTTNANSNNNLEISTGDDVYNPMISGCICACNGESCICECKKTDYNVQPEIPQVIPQPPPPRKKYVAPEIKHHNSYVTDKCGKSPYVSDDSPFGKYQTPEEIYNLNLDGDYAPIFS